jgi:hypothetical protein
MGFILILIPLWQSKLQNVAGHVTHQLPSSTAAATITQLKLTQLSGQSITQLSSCSRQFDCLLSLFCLRRLLFLSLFSVCSYLIHFISQLSFLSISKLINDG